MWIVFLIIAVVVIIAISSGSKSKSERISEYGRKGAAVLIGEFPQFSTDITPEKVAMLVEAVQANVKEVKGHLNWRSKPKNEASRVFLRDYTIDKLTPIISPEFYEYAKANRDEVYNKMDKALEKIA
ncbi:MAG: hypothetical protein ACSHW6_00105 [Sulfitobacter geojensis]